MPARKSIENNLPSYRKPPVVEVACGLRFKPLESWKLAHVGLFWDMIREEFPRCEHALPLDFGPGIMDVTTNLPLPRVWFINEDGDRLVQLQRNAFFYNWRLRSEKKPYPRYKNTIQNFEKYFDLFSDFVEREKLDPIEPTECELTYINHIPMDHGWKSAADIGKIIPDFRWRSSVQRPFLRRPSLVTWRASFDLPEKRGRLHVKMEQVQRKIDDTPILLFELSVRGLGEEKSWVAIRPWFDLAHEWIVRGFADLTSPKVQQQVWKRDDDFTGTG